MSSAAVIARACYEAYAAKDRDAIEALIADDFHFTSPLDNRIDRKTYFARCWPNSETIEEFDILRIAVDGEEGGGERVFVTYVLRGAAGRSFRNTEILTVRGGQIVEAEVYFGWSVPHEAPAGGFTPPDQILEATP